MFKEDVSILAFDELLLEKGIVDSMGIIQLTEFLQEQFGISLTTSDMVLENFASINAISKMVQSRKVSI